MPLPLLPHILRLLTYQTGRCLLTFSCLSHIHFGRLVEAICELSEERRSLLLQTAAILYMHSITGSLSPYECINLFFAHRLNSPGYYSHNRLSAYSSGFCEPLAYEVPISFRFPSVTAGWNVCHMIDCIMVGKDGGICWELFSRQWCTRVLKAEHHKLQWLHMWFKGIKYK